MVTDLTDVFATYTDAEFCGVYAMCHVLGMLSACANPVIYGFLNENFSKEFVAIGRWWVDKLRLGKCWGRWRRWVAVR